MRIRWRNFELPSKVVSDRETLTDEYGRFMIEPFEQGFGHTIGNGLRRVLLSSIEGTAVTAVRIAGASHEARRDVVRSWRSKEPLEEALEGAGRRRMVRGRRRAGDRGDAAPVDSQRRQVVEAAAAHERGVHELRRARLARIQAGDRRVECIEEGQDVLVERGIDLGQHGA